MNKKAESLGDFVAQKIKEFIFKEQIFKPGDQLPVEKELAEQLNVSRTALREGIKKLEADNILVIRRGVGTFVSEDFGLDIDTAGLTYEDLQRKILLNWYEARLVWEVPSMRLVAQNATDDDLRRMEEIQSQINAVIDEDSADFYELDHQFHLSMTMATHNNILIKMSESSSLWIWPFFIVAQQRRDLQPYMKKNARNNHDKVLDFLKKRDGEGAVLAMRYHLITAIDDLKY